MEIGLMDALEKLRRNSLHEINVTFVITLFGCMWIGFSDEGWWKIPVLIIFLGMSVGWLYLIVDNFREERTRRIFAFVVSKFPDLQYYTTATSEFWSPKGIFQSGLLPSWTEQAYMSSDENVEGLISGAEIERARVQLSKGLRHVDLEIVLYQIRDIGDKEVYIFEDRRGFFKRPSKKDGFSQAFLESNELERFFDIYANDQLMVRQLLTPDIMEVLINIRKDFSGRSFAMSFIGKTLYIMSVRRPYVLLRSLLKRTSPAAEVSAHLDLLFNFMKMAALLKIRKPSATPRR